MDNSETLTVQQKMMVKKFRKVVNDILKPEDDDDFLLRWLRARDFDLGKAEKMLRKSVKLIYNIEAEDLFNSDYEIPKLAEKYLPTQLWGFDNEGSPVRLILTGLLDLGGVYRAFNSVDTVRLLTFIMGSDMKLAKENAKKTGSFNQQSVLVLDYKGFNVRQTCDKLVLTKSIFLVQMYQENFPELLKIAYLINIPPLFQTVLNIFKPFLHDKTWKKFKTFSDDSWKLELMEHVDPKIIPKHFGGKNEDCSMEPAMYLKRTDGGKIPSKCYLKDDLYLKATDPGMKTTVVQERNYFNHKVNIQTPGSIITWIFQTKDYNIKFGVFYKPSQSSKNNSLGEEIIKCQVVESQSIPEKDELLCEAVGEYCLRFDNTYSWMVKKTLLLKVEVKPPL